MNSVCEIKVGSLVWVTAGRDKHRYYVAVAVHDGFVEIADGRKRRAQKPKRKNVKHISLVEYPVYTGELTDKRLRRLINEYLTHTDLQQTESL